MPRRGRQQKYTSLYSVKNLIEYTSDSESDAYNVLHNRNYEVSNLDRSPIRERQDGQRHELHQRPVQEQEPDQHMPEELDHHMPQEEILQEPDQHRPEEAIVQELDHHMPQEEILQEPDPHMPREAMPRQDADQEHDEISESDNDDEENVDEIEDFNTILEKLKSEWIEAEIDHCVSKTASDVFWRIGLNYFPKLEAAFGRRRKKVSQFKSLRRTMYDELVPPIELEIAYRDKSTGEISVVKDTNTPLKRFSSSKYEKLYEIGTIKVRLFSNKITKKNSKLPDRPFLDSCKITCLKFCRFFFSLRTSRQSTNAIIMTRMLYNLVWTESRKQSQQVCHLMFTVSNFKGAGRFIQ